MNNFKGTTYLVPSLELTRIISRNDLPIRFLLNNAMYALVKLKDFGSTKYCFKRSESGN